MFGMTKRDIGFSVFGAFKRRLKKIIYNRVGVWYLQVDQKTLKIYMEKSSNIYRTQKIFILKTEKRMLI